MFEQTFVNTEAQKGKPWSVALSLSLQVGLVATLLLLPLLHQGSITPNFSFSTPLVVTKLEPPPLPPEVTTAVAAVRTQVRRAFVDPYRPGRGIPTTIDMSPDPAPEILELAPIAASTVLNALPVPAPPRVLPPPQVVTTPVPSGPVTVVSAVQSALLIYSPKPLFPPLARAARVQGTVRMHALIGRDGNVQNLQVVGGPPLLTKAALDAVSQWRYRPTLLNGVAVEVTTEIDVNFVLN